MPTKTIYVSNDDQSTFERAQDLAGENLSAVIVRALSEFIARKEAAGKGMKEVSVQIGTKGLQSEKRFVGRLIAKWKGLDDAGKEWLEAQIYRTKRDQTAVVIDHKGSTEMWHPDAWRDPNNWQNVVQGKELLVFSSTDEMKGKVPENLVVTTRQAIERDEAPVQYLDI